MDKKLFRAKIPKFDSCTLKNFMCGTNNKKQEKWGFNFK